MTQVRHGDRLRKKSKTGEDGSLETEEDRRPKKKRNGFDLDLIWIEIGVFKNILISRNELARPVMVFIVCWFS